MVHLVHCTHTHASSSLKSASYQSCVAKLGAHFKMTLGEIEINAIMNVVGSSLATLDDYNGVFTTVVDPERNWNAEWELSDSSR